MLLVRHDSAIGDGRLYIFCNRLETTFCLPGTLKADADIVLRSSLPPKVKLCAASHLDERMVELWPNMTVFPIKYTCKNRVFKIRGGDITVIMITFRLTKSQGTCRSQPVHKTVKISTPMISVNYYVALTLCSRRSRQPRYRSP